MEDRFQKQIWSLWVYRDALWVMQRTINFQSMINDVFRDMLDVGVIAYMDDILIYTETVE